MKQKEWEEEVRKKQAINPDFLAKQSEAGDDERGKHRKRAQLPTCGGAGLDSAVGSPGTNANTAVESVDSSPDNTADSEKSICSPCNRE